VLAIQQGMTPRVLEQKLFALAGGVESAADGEQKKAA
jgi:hypothetical protein